MNQKRLVIGNQLTFIRDGSPVYNALTGTVGVTNGSTALAGTGTSFESALVVGSHLLINGVVATIASITSDTAAVLSAAWAGATASLLTAGVQAGTSSNAALPGTFAGNWLSAGTVEDATINSKKTVEDVMAPSPFAYQRADRLATMRSLDISCTIQQMSEIIYEMLLQSGQLTDATAFSPGAGTGQIRGWVQLSQGDGLNVQRATMQCYAIMEMTALQTNGKLSKPKIDIFVVYNALNTGVTALAA